MNTRESNQKEVASDDPDENAGFNGAELSESVLARDWNSPEEAPLLEGLDIAAAQLDAGKGIPIGRVREDIRRWVKNSKK